MHHSAKIAKSATILNKIQNHTNKLLGKEFHSDKLMPFLTMVMIERLNALCSGALVILNQPHFSGKLLCIKVLFRPVILDHILFTYSEKIRHEGKKNLLSDEKIDDELEEYYAVLLADGINQTKNHIKFLGENNLINEEKLNFYTQEFGTAYEPYITIIKQKSKKEIKQPKDLVIDMYNSDNEFFKFITYCYENYQMAFSKSEHFGILSHDMARTNQEFNANLILDSAIDCYRHLVFLSVYLNTRQDLLQVNSSVFDEILSDNDFVFSKE